MRPPTCPLCGGSTERASLFQPYAYWRCTGCRSSHLSPRPSTEDIRGYYERFHFPAEEGGLFAEFEDRTLVDFPSKARILARQLGVGGIGPREAKRVLDVGCGKGYFVRELTRVGFLAEWIDLSVRAVEEGRTNCGIQGLRAGTLEDQTDWAHRFDAVTAWATIEHLPSPGCFLESVRNVLKPSGHLFLDTGLADDFLERWAPGLTQWYDAPQHLFVFSRRGLEILLGNSGFSVLLCDTNFERSFTRRFLKSARNRLLAVAGTCLFRIALGGTAYRRMRMETKMPFGSLMFIVARRGE